MTWSIDVLIKQIKNNKCNFLLNRLIVTVKLQKKSINFFLTQTQPKMVIRITSKSTSKMLGLTTTKKQESIKLY